MDPGDALAAACAGGPLAEDLPLAYVLRCTDYFAPARLLGEGAFGRVYRGADAVQGAPLVLWLAVLQSNAVKNVKAACGRRA